MALVWLSLTEQLLLIWHDLNVKYRALNARVLLLRVLFPALITSAGLVVLWWFLERLLASPRGLDLSDEGLYLLAADPPSSTAAWGFPFGWHTRPLFALVGNDIASFRTLGAVVLVISFGWLGWASVHVALPAKRLVSTRAMRLLASIATLTGALGALNFYAPMLRTPSYNWLNIVGMSISAAAALSFIHVSRVNRTSFGRFHMLLLAVLSSGALFMTFPAKPSTLPLLLLLTTLLVVGVSGWQTGAKWFGWNLVLMPAWLAISLAVRLWPFDFISVFLRTLQMPAPDPLQTTSSAIRAVFLLPRDFAAGLAAAQNGPALLLVTSAVVLLVPVIAARTWIPIRIVGFGLATGAALAIAGVPVPLLQPTGQAFGIASSAVTTAGLIILGAALISSARLRPRMVAEEGYQRKCVPRWLLVIFLVLLPFVFSFGSGNGIYAQASLAVGFIFIAAFVGVMRGDYTRNRLILTGFVLFATGLIAMASIASGWQAPFRTAPLAENTATTSIGDRGATLLLEPKLSEDLSRLRALAEENGWQPATPLVDVSYMWNPAVPYSLGARMPESLALTIFGYAAAHDIVDFHLSAPFRGFPFDQAWFLTSRPSSIADPSGQKAVDFTMEKLSVVTGRPFPESYTCLSAGDFMLWKPVLPEQGNGSDCDG